MREQHEIGRWYRSGALVYRLKHHGWRKGEEVLCNETTIRVEGKDQEKLAEELVDYLRMRDAE